MSAELLSSKRVSVQGDTYSFVVLVDTQPVLRCTDRKNALHYAALVRKALERAGPIRGDSESPKLPPKSRKIHD